MIGRKLAAAIAVLTAGCVASTLPAASPLFEVVREGPLVEDRAITRGAAWGDYDGDGDPDLFITRPTWDGVVQHNVLYRNEGAGRFVVAGSGEAMGPAGAWEGVVWVDIDGDGDLDLHVLGRDGSGVLFFENDGGGNLELLATDPFGGRIRAASMACWADFDGDGRLDVFVVGYGDGRNALFRNVADWRFEAVALPARPEDTGAGRACAAGDLDGDNLPEVVVANARRANVLYRNAGGMRLVSDTTTGLQQDVAYGYGASWADVNEDGLRDLFIANFDAGNALYLGMPDGGLQPIELGDELQSPATKGHVWADFDLDGRQDVYLGSGTPQPGMLNRLYLGRAGGRFMLSDIGEFAMHGDTSAAIAGADYDLDGDTDLFVANWGSHDNTNRLYRNTATGGGWLRVRLEGSRSDRMGVGARASVRFVRDGEPVWIHRWLDLSTGYAGQNEPVLHFGIGPAARVDSLVVAWPSGVVSRIGEVPAGSEVRIVEGSEAPVIEG